jgi:Cytochrome bd terminal oxidase subunit I
LLAHFSSRLGRASVAIKGASKDSKADTLMELDPVLLSRLQFAWVVAWHILLPAFTVGLASFIAMLECLSTPVTAKPKR